MSTKNEMSMGFWKDPHLGSQPEAQERSLICEGGTLETFLKVWVGDAF